MTLTSHWAKTTHQKENKRKPANQTNRDHQGTHPTFLKTIKNILIHFIFVLQVFIAVDIKVSRS